MRDSILRADSIVLASELAARKAALAADTIESPDLEALAREWLEAPLIFEHGSTTLSRPMREALLLKADVLAANPNVQVILTGAADTTGSEEVNEAIAQARAAEVRRQLVAAGASSGQLLVASSGETAAALVATDSWDRRVDFRLAGQMLQVPNALGRKVLNAGEPWRMFAASARDTVAVVRLFYSTDRLKSGKPDPDLFYGNDRSDSLTYGRIEVSIPYTRHARGRIEGRSFFDWFLGKEERDSTRFFVLGTPVEATRASWQDSVRAALSGSAKNELFVYINGYNVSFRDAAMKAAQLTLDLELRSVPMVYSWTSFGETLKYGADLNSAELTAPRLARFLRSVASETGADRVNVLAHSMGNRALLFALQELRGVGDTILGRVILAAPDEDQAIFRQRVSHLLARARGVTLYASSRDKALRLAQDLRGGQPRAGQAGRHLLILDGIETIDASDVDTDFLSHGYQGNSLQVLDDLRLLVNLGLDASDRLTKRRVRDGRAYWYLSPRTR